MVMEFAIRSSFAMDWGRAAIGGLACCFGCLALFCPVVLSRLHRRAGRDSLGTSLALYNPDQVARSWFLRLQYRVGGAIILMFGLALLGLVWDAIGVFGVALVVLGVGLCTKRGDVLALLGTRADGGATLRARSRWGLCAVGIVSALVGGWILLAHR